MRPVEANACNGVCTAQIGANVRTGPSTSYSIITTIAYNGQVSVTGRSGNWWTVSVSGKTGYMLGSLLRVPGVVNANIGLNVRSGPGTSYSIVGSLSHGSSVSITDISNGWYKVSGGYVSATYIQLSGSSTPSGGGSSSGGTSTSAFRMVDVSVWDDNIDFKTVKANGCAHVIIRATYGTSGVDKNFKKNIENAINAGMTIGIYHYGYATSVSMAEQEAQHCINTINPYKKNIKFPVAYDVEDDCMQVGREKTTDMILAFCRKIKAAGYIPWLYSNPNWIYNYLNINRVYDDGIDLWIAQYYYKCTYTGAYAAWQYGAEPFPGFESGIEADMNWGYKKY